MNKIKGYVPKKPIPSPFQPADMLGSIETVVKMAGDLNRIKKDIETKIQQVDRSTALSEKAVQEHIYKIKEAIVEFENTAISLIQEIQSIPHLQGPAGKDAFVDEDKIISNVLAKIPKPPTIDEEKLLKKFISKIPENKADLKIINESIDPEVVAEKIVDMAKKGKFKIPHEGIIGTETAMESYLRKFGYKPYVHGGGDTVGAGTNITITNVNGVKVISATGGSGSGYQAPTGTVNGVNTVFTYATAPGAIVVDGLTIRKTASDGTVNWTGTTVVTLAVAPNFDTFAVA